MKALSIIITYIIFTALTMVSTIKAQEFDQKPDEPLKGTWYSSNPAFSRDHQRSINPRIADLIGQVKSDSIRSTIQHMQEYITRFPLVDNRKIIAGWIADKFRSYG